VGMGAYEKNDLHFFFVRPDHHRKGIESALLHKVLEEAKKEGIKIMYCHSSFFAEPFYLCIAWISKDR
jgi:GNAT superfamily N-acetyltransferase